MVSPSLIFKKVSFKNFLSTGNSEIIIDLQKADTTLIIGANGSGKSTLLDVLTFVLYNKPFRAVNRGQLINSINGKQLVGSVNFSIDRVEYEVIRGQKPNIFEIYQDGKLVNQEANSRDYQDILETRILKLNYKTFTQVVILGSASYAPFMQLTPAIRREIIEDILDIKIFSIMNILLKERMADNKKKIRVLESSMETKREIARSKKHIIELLSQSKEDLLNTIRSKISSVESELRVMDLEKNEILKRIPEIAVITKNLEILKENISRAEDKINEIGTKILTFSSLSNSNCPLCLQSIGENHVDHALDYLMSNKSEESNKLDKLKSVWDLHSHKINDLKDCNRELSNLAGQIKVSNDLLVSLQEEKNIIQSTPDSADEERKELRDIGKLLVELHNEYSEAVSQKEVYDIAGLLLKDTGIKATIISKYLPIINESINYYLSALDSFIQFDLDESFNEKIRSRYRDLFSYSSFSEGEKQRIDLAIMFTWRHIAKLKNSANTNLLIFDEILDSALDFEGIQGFLDILHKTEGSNIFVISHRGDVMLDKFKEVLVFEKKGNFSEIVL